MKDNRSPFRQWQRADAVRRFVRNIHPCNVFFVPLDHRAIGEDPAVISHFAARARSFYGAVWDEFVHFTCSEAEMPFVAALNGAECQPERPNASEFKDHAREPRSELAPRDRQSAGGARRWRKTIPRGAAVDLAEVRAMASGPDPGRDLIVSHIADRTFVHYSRTRVWLGRAAWEYLRGDRDVLVLRVNYPGKRPYTIALTRSELEDVFGEVRSSRSWDDVRCYHFPAEPRAVESVRVHVTTA